MSVPWKKMKESAVIVGRSKPRRGFDFSMSSAIACRVKSETDDAGDMVVPVVLVHVPVPVRVKVETETETDDADRDMVVPVVEAAAKPPVEVAATSPVEAAMSPAFNGTDGSAPPDSKLRFTPKRHRSPPPPVMDCGAAPDSSLDQKRARSVAWTPRAPDAARTPSVLATNIQRSRDIRDEEIQMAELKSEMRSIEIRVQRHQERITMLKAAHDRAMR